MTINLHSYIEEQSEKKLNDFVEAVCKIAPDVIAMQEVNQRTESKEISDSLITNQFGIRMKADNYGLRIARKLLRKGQKYHLFWVGIKNGYKVFDEGLCFLSKAPALSSEAFNISKTEDSSDWRKRMALGIKIDDVWFYNVHMGRWDDEKEPFLKQWEIFEKRIKDKENIWILGDFNAPSDAVGEGYDLVTSSGFYDSYILAAKKDTGFTVREKIDGWQDLNSQNFDKRIDYIFVNKKTDIKSSFTIFNGENENKISDHFGIIVNT